MISLSSRGPKDRFGDWGMFGILQTSVYFVASQFRNGCRAVLWFTYQYFLVLSLAVRLFANLSFHYVWVWMFVRVVLFVNLVLPALLSFCYVYFTFPLILRNIAYGTNPRNLLDIYLPSRNLKANNNAPVVIFVSGGAWVIGYKAWGACTGFILRIFGVITVMPDYRNHPQGEIEDMLADVSTAVEWTLQNIEKYGGDPHNVTLIGQSAGCNLICLSLIRQAMVESKLSGMVNGGKRLELENAFRLPFTWRPSQIRAFIGISGPYNTSLLVDHLDARGLPRDMMSQIFLDNFDVFSPSHLIASDEFDGHSAKYFPPVTLVHGIDDVSCPVEQSKEFQAVLESKGIFVSTCYYPGKSHTDPIIEDFMRGDDPLISDILKVIFPGEKLPAEIPEVYYQDYPILRYRLPRILIALASWINPF